MRLLELLDSAKVCSVSVVGLAKNAGKTVALNSLIRQAAQAGVALGLSSIGYDGEKIDLVSRLPKPRIEVVEGTILATASGTLERSTAALEILAATGFVTALGEVLLVRTRESGYVEIAGPDSYGEMQKCIGLMLKLGCQLALIDGALDRVGSASPAVTEAAILATGAVAGGSMRQILMRTLHFVSLCSLPKLSEGARRAAAVRATLAGQLLLSTSQGERVLPFASALGHAAAIADCLPRDEEFALVVPGAVYESLLGEIMQRPRLARQALLISADPTHIFATPEVWQKYRALGGRVAVLEQIRLLAATVNPTAPSGKAYEPRQFAAEIAASLAPLPVYDLFDSDQAVCL